jgi:hypothetical protein
MLKLPFYEIITIASLPSRSPWSNRLLSNVRHFTTAAMGALSPFRAIVASGQ